MKIVHRDLAKGEVVMIVENDDDLWVLNNIIRPGDVVFASTHRKEERASDKLRPERSERRRVYLGLEVESVEFAQFSGDLRVHGVIVEAPFDTGSYHTIVVNAGTKLKVVRRFTQLDMKILEESVADAKRPNVVFVSMDDETATIAFMSKRGVNSVCDIAGPGSGKMFKVKRDDEYFADVASSVENIDTEYVVIVGPGFTKESFISYLKDRQLLADRKLHTESAGAAGMSGINEVLKKGALSRFLKDSRTGEEVEAVERVLAAISGGGDAAYGVAEVRHALELGAVEELLIMDHMARDGQGDTLFRMARGTNARTLVVSSGHDGGRKLDGLGGVAALLRYRVGST